MKKIALSMMALVIAFSSMAQSADKKSGEHKEFRKGERHMRGGENFEKLNLSEAQRSQIKTLNESFRQQMQELNKQGNITVDQQKAKRRELAEQHKQQIQAILTPEQRQQAQELKKDFKEGKQDRAHSGKEGKRDGGRFQDLTKDLNLTADQSTKVAALNQTLKTNVQSIQQNTALAQEEKRTQMKSLMQKHKSDIEALLTADQKEQLKSRLKNRPNRAVK